VKGAVASLDTEYPSLGSRVIVLLFELLSKDTDEEPLEKVAPESIVVSPVTFTSFLSSINPVSFLPYASTASSVAVTEPPGFGLSISPVNVGLFVLYSVPPNL
jgi:hypothetical protein